MVHSLSFAILSFMCSSTNLDTFLLETSSLKTSLLINMNFALAKRKHTDKLLLYFLQIFSQSEYGL